MLLVKRQTIASFRRMEDHFVHGHTDGRAPGMPPDELRLHPPRPGPNNNRLMEREKKESRPIEKRKRFSFLSYGFL